MMFDSHIRAYKLYRSISCLAKDQKWSNLRKNIFCNHEIDLFVIFVAMLIWATIYQKAKNETTDSNKISEQI